MTTFKALGLGEMLLSAIQEQGFETPTPIQQAAIPPLLLGEDVTGQAQTGGGKTAAFVLPIIHKLIEQNSRFISASPQAIILAPTRELANQIGECVRMFARHSNIRHTVISGGNPFRPQIMALQKGIHILIATPGRLQDHVRRGNVNFGNVQFFILDEADRMLDMGFVDEVNDIAKKMPDSHQTILFSATMSPAIRKLSQALQKDPVRVDIDTEVSVADTIQHRVMHVMRENKSRLLAYLFEKEKPFKTLIFTRTKMDADKLCKSLEYAGHSVDALHGDKKQSQRQRILQSFKLGKINILVATDVASRGIDVKDISLVINYDMPLEAENYIHRVGRTGRAGESGMAISFCSPGDMRLLVNVQNLLNMPVQSDNDHEWHFEPNRTSHKRKDFGKKRNPSHKHSAPRPVREVAKRKFSNDRGDSNNGFSSTPHWKKDKAKSSDDRFVTPERGARSFGDKPKFGKPRFDGDKPKSADDRSANRGTRNYGDKPKFGKPRFDGDKPKSADDRSANRGTRNYGDKPKFAKPRFEGDKPKSADDRSANRGTRSYGDKPQLAKPQWSKDAPRKSNDRYKKLESADTAPQKKPKPISMRELEMEVRAHDRNSTKKPDNREGRKSFAGKRSVIGVAGSNPRKAVGKSGKPKRKANDGGFAPVRRRNA